MCKVIAIASQKGGVAKTTTAGNLGTGLVRKTYGDNVKIFENSIPFSVRAAEISVEGTSIYQYAPKSKVALAYEALVREVLQNG